MGNCNKRHNDKPEETTTTTTTTTTTLSYAEYKQKEEQKQKQQRENDDEDDDEENGTNHKFKVKKNTPLPTFETSSSQSALLSEDQLRALVSFLSADYQKATWRMLFSIAQHGAAMTTFYDRVAEKGPLLLIAKDTNGHMFGGFADAGVTRFTKFYGSNSSFVFSLHPNIHYYRATESNKNYIYFNLDKKHHDLQSGYYCGFGMGGQIGYFSFGIHEDFKHGEARASCVTFAAPCLASEEVFTLAELEVFGFVGKEYIKGSAYKNGVTANDKATAKYLLETAGIIQDYGV